VAGGKWWGLVLGMVPTIGGGLALLMFITTNGGVPVFLYPGAVASFGLGILSLYFWARGRPDASQNVSIALRAILYVCLAAALMFLLAYLLL